MALQETVTYEIKVRLSTVEGECPSEYEFERLVADQMAGVLDEDTHLHTIAVFSPRIVTEEEQLFEKEEVDPEVMIRCSWCDDPATHRDIEGKKPVADYYCSYHLGVWGEADETEALR